MDKREKEETRSERSVSEACPKLVKGRRRKKEAFNRLQNEGSTYA